MPRVHGRPWVAYVVPFPFPWGQAGSRRVLGVSRSIAATGRDVVVLARPHGAAEPGDGVVLADPSGATVTVLERPSLPAGALGRQWAHHVVGSADALDLIDARASQLPSHVLVYGTTATPLGRAFRWGRRRRVPVIADVVERYAPQQFAGGRLSPGYLSSAYGFSAISGRVDGVIAISRHLEAHFSRLGVPTVRVPPTLDVAALPEGRPRSDLAVGYFGSPGRKDLLDVVVEAVARVRQAMGQEGLTLVVAGPGTQEALRSRSLTGVELLGNVPQGELPSVVGAMTATVLARPVERYSDAGFPTKVVESLSVGTPVVCNMTSDLADVITEGETGWVAEEPTVSAVAAALTRMVAATPGARQAMRARARQVAFAHFDTAAYAAPLDHLLARTAR